MSGKTPPAACRLVRGSVYACRLALLDSLPACFTGAEFRACAGLSRDAAWQTLRRWVAAGCLSVPGRGLYRRPDIPMRLPPEVHRAAAAAGVGAYFTGWAALVLVRRRLKRPGRLDVVTGRRTAAKDAARVDGFRRHCLRLVRWEDGLLPLEDGGRPLRVASPERVVADALACPGRFMTPAGVVELLRGGRRIDSLRLLELVSRLGSEAVRRRLVVVAGAAGRKRLARWASELGPFSPGMGRVRLDPSAPAPRGTPVVAGVLVNAPLGATEG